MTNRRKIIIKEEIRQKDGIIPDYELNGTLLVGLPA